MTTTHNRLRKLGFSNDICAISIDKTMRVMKTEMSRNRTLHAKVLSIVKSEYTNGSTTDANVEFRIDEWIRKHAAALHAEQTRNILRPFKAVIDLMKL